MAHAHAVDTIVRGMRLTGYFEPNLEAIGNYSAWPSFAAMKRDIDNDRMWQIVFRNPFKPQLVAFHNDKTLLMCSANGENVIEVNLIAVHARYRKQGRFSRCMNDMCRIADKYNITLTGTVKPVIITNDRVFNRSFWKDVNEYCLKYNTSDMPHSFKYSDIDYDDKNIAAWRHTLLNGPWGWEVRAVNNIVRYPKAEKVMV